MVTWLNRLFKGSARSDRAIVSTPAQDSTAAPVCAPPKAELDPALAELKALLRAGGRADIEVIDDSAVYGRVRRFYEELCSESGCPDLTYYCLTRKSAAATHEHLVVAAGARTEHDKAWRYDSEPALKRAVPGGSWDQLTRGSHSNHSKPGCTLASAAPFHRLAGSILDGGYRLDTAIRPAGPAIAAEATSAKWDALIIGDAVDRPDLACELCGDKSVVPGMYASHLKCMRCGARYCRRNCMASIHDQCPRCGEADRVNSVEFATAPTAR